MYHNSQILSSTKYVMLFGLNRNIKEFTELKNLPLIEGLCNYICWDISELNIYIYIIYTYNIYIKIYMNLPAMQETPVWSLGLKDPLAKKMDISVQFSSVAQSCPTLCDPMNCSTPGFPVLHYLSEFVQIHVHWDGDAIQPSHPLSSPSPLAFKLSQNQYLVQWVSSSHQATKVSELHL